MVIATTPKIDLKIGLTIAGFDPSGGAGVLADCRTFAAHGIYAEACITALTVQSTQGVEATQPVPAGWIDHTLACMARDNSFSVIKIGMLGTSLAAAAVAEFLASQRHVPIVVDPVMRSSSGAELLDRAGLSTLQELILPLATWVTPNFVELSVLTGNTIAGRDEVEDAAKKLRNAYPKINLLITGGEAESHDQSPDDYLWAADDAAGQWIPGHRVETCATHGTGCTLSSALAARLALFPAESAAERVAACKRYVEGAMLQAPGIGRGAGPLEHFWRGLPARS